MSLSSSSAFSNSLLGSHVFFQRTLYSWPLPVHLLSTIFKISHPSTSFSVESGQPRSRSGKSEVATVKLWGWTITAAPWLPPWIVCPSGEVERSTGEVTGGVVKRVFARPGAFGCSLGWELETCVGSVSDSTLVVLMEAPISLVVSPSSSKTRGLSEVPLEGIQAFNQKRAVAAQLG